jgi:hypothetical protein
MIFSKTTLSLAVLREREKILTNDEIYMSGFLIASSESKAVYNERSRYNKK